MNAIDIRQLHKSFKDLDVLAGVDLAVPTGSILALLGSNGAGKTTLVKILCTLLPADSGEVLVNGFNAATQPAQVRACLGLTGQFAAIDDILTGRENLVLMARLLRLHNPGRLADNLLERFDLTDAAGRRAASYSGGMRRRLDLAMSLIGNPSILVLDEPTTGLDPQARTRTWDIVRELSAAGTTVLLTTQYLEEAEQLANHVAILHGGAIIQQGSPQELRQLLPPPRVEKVVTEASLEEVFLSLTAEPRPEGTRS